MLLAGVAERGWLVPGLLNGLAELKGCRVWRGEGLLPWRCKAVEILGSPGRLHPEAVEELHLGQALAGEHGAIKFRVVHRRLDIVARPVAQGFGPRHISREKTQEQMKILLAEDMLVVAIGAQGEEFLVPPLPDRREKGDD